MNKVRWQHPSVHSSDTWVEDFEFEDKDGKYFAKSKDAPVKVYLKNNKGIIIKYEKRN